MSRTVLCAYNWATLLEWNGEKLNNHETDSWIALVSFTTKTTSACLASTGLSNTPACWHIVPHSLSGSCVSWVKLSLSCSLTCICTWSKIHGVCLYGWSAFFHVFGNQCWWVVQFLLLDVDTVVCASMSPPLRPERFYLEGAISWFLTGMYPDYSLACCLTLICTILPLA